jgi:uncharacterized protein with NRDE domain
MCLALVALHAHPRYPLVIAANRDEFHARDAEPAHWWPEGILAGTDRVGGGTWFGVTRHGRWALVTNFREGVARDPHAPSRGELVTRALAAAQPPLECAARMAVDGERFHGFNLLIGDGSSAAYVSNRASGGIALGAGIHGLSNHLLETPWPKLVRSKAKLETALSGGGDPIDAAFRSPRRPRTRPPALPATGVPPHMGAVASSAFIVNADYGTRCSTVLTIDAAGAARFVERSFDALGGATGEIAQAFAIQPREPS